MTGLKGTPWEARAAGHLINHATVTVVVRCGFIGCPWSIEIGEAPLEAHSAYLDHLDVHDPDHVAAADNCDQEAGEELARTDEAIDELAAVVGLYAGDSPQDIAAAQARVDRFMAGGNDV